MRWIKKKYSTKILHTNALGSHQVDIEEKESFYHMEGWIEMLIIIESHACVVGRSVAQQLIEPNWRGVTLWKPNESGKRFRFLVVNNNKWNDSYYLPTDVLLIFDGIIDVFVGYT